LPEWQAVKVTFFAPLFLQKELQFAQLHESGVKFCFLIQMFIIDQYLYTLLFSVIDTL